MSDPDYSLFTSLRYDPELILTSWNNKSPLLLENYHVQRLQAASEKFGWKAAIDLTGSEDFASKFRVICKDAVKQFTGEEQVVLIRITLSFQGEMAFVTLPGVFYPYGMFERAEWSPEKGDPGHTEFNYTVYLDNTPIHPSIFTSYKTTKRDHYNAARTRANIQSRAEMKEIILFNDDGKIMEGSVCCVAFWRNGAWLMPPLSAGGLAGVDRRWLLEQGKVQEGDISRDEVKEGEYILLTNGWIGAQLGKVTLILPESSAKSMV